MLVLMADVVPKGYYAASLLPKVPQTQLEDITAAIIGRGPVGVCAIASTVYLKGAKAKIRAVDSVPEHLEEARKLGAVLIALPYNPVLKVKEAPFSRTADVVMEFVGHADALELDFDMIRPFGKISSMGVHSEQISLPDFAPFSKNVTIVFGRCPPTSSLQNEVGECLGL